MLADIKSELQTGSETFICNIACKLGHINDNVIDAFKPDYPELYATLDRRRKYMFAKYGVVNMMSGGLWPTQDRESRIKVIDRLITKIEKRNGKAKS